MDFIDEIVQVDPRYQIFGRLLKAYRYLERIGDCDVDGLSVKQWFQLFVLHKLFETPPSLRQMSEKMGTSRQNSKRIVLTLEKRGFVELRDDEADRRTKRIYLTEKAYAYLEKRDREDGAVIEEWSGMFDESQLRYLESILPPLLEMIENRTRTAAEIQD